jgi:hypothetical protein
MPTHSQEFQESLTQWKRLADDFSIYGFELSKARDLTTEVGSRTEVLLKTAVLPHISPRTTFNDCINALEPLGVDQPDRDTLHDLRQLYNTAKHDPKWNPSLLDLQEVIPRVSEVIRCLTESSIGLLNAEKQTRFHQIFWVAAWDHFIGGDSEVQIVAPFRGGYPPTLDLVYVDIARWHQVKSTLATAGSLRQGQGLIPDDVLLSFREDSDFHQAVVFEGSFRDLIAVLAAFERREDLLPELRREDDPQAMMHAFILATLDSAQQLESSFSLQGLTTAISRRAVEAYAVPDNYHSLAAQSSQFAEMVAALPESRKTQVNGPIWVAGDEFGTQAAGALAKHPRLPVLINREGTFLIKFPS